MSTARSTLTGAFGAVIALFATPVHAGTYWANADIALSVTAIDVVSGDGWDPISVSPGEFYTQWVFLTDRGHEEGYKPAATPYLETRNEPFASGKVQYNLMTASLETGIQSTAPKFTGAYSQIFIKNQGLIEVNPGTALQFDFSYDLQGISVSTSTASAYGLGYASLFGALMDDEGNPLDEFDTGYLIGGAGFGYRGTVTYKLMNATSEVAYAYFGSHSYAAVNVVPEPAVTLLLPAGIVIAGLGGIRRRRQTNHSGW